MSRNQKKGITAWTYKDGLWPLEMTMPAVFCECLGLVAIITSMFLFNRAYFYKIIMIEERRMILNVFLFYIRKEKQKKNRLYGVIYFLIN